MVANWLEQVGCGSQFVRVSGPIGQSKWVIVADWSEQVGHGSQFVRVSGLR